MAKNVAAPPALGIGPVWRIAGWGRQGKSNTRNFLAAQITKGVSAKAIKAVIKNIEKRLILSYHQNDIEQAVKKQNTGN